MSDSGAARKPYTLPTWALVAVVAAAFIAGVAFAISRQQEKISPLVLPTLSGEKINIPGNKPMWINFWSATCPPCLQEIPLLDKLQREYAGKAQIVAISVPYDPPNITKDIQERFHLTLPMALDIDGKAAMQFDADMPVPSHYLIDEKGNILLSLRGEVSEKIVRDALGQHLWTDP